MPDNDLRTIYEDTYLAIRAKYGHPDEPVSYRGRLGAVETLPPKDWSKTKYAAYFDEVMRLGRWFKAASKYAAKKRKTHADRTAYLEACDRYGVAGHDLLFAGEPAQTALI
ncbi:hypothetical protein [Actinomadura opuntiae]|uniref:hypothetical protein n=1 Tax=Actinomadura sp. OS1-43 TaxID=604315 RepID=UPI00255ABBA2|nr:hypothetical protein [Actinomadura sp. OS1-43]MDL4815481.1 hypothetical protein [Actinomadura sp. OS1-43]